MKAIMYHMQSTPVLTHSTFSEVTLTLTVNRLSADVHLMEQTPANGSSFIHTTVPVCVLVEVIFVFYAQVHNCALGRERCRNT